MSAKDRIGWKKAVALKSARQLIVKLKIIGKVVSPYDDDKHRCLKAKVLGIYYLNGTRSPARTCVSACYYTSDEIPKRERLHYTVGKVVTADGLNLNRSRRCGQGINFFWDRKRAERYT